MVPQDDGRPARTDESTADDPDGRTEATDEVCTWLSICSLFLKKKGQGVVGVTRTLLIPDQQLCGIRSADACAVPSPHKMKENGRRELVVNRPPVRMDMCLDKPLIANGHL